ncbi:hypothetical protein [Sandaracinobacteroides hominis]|uniref:hypothetical protein n=1 Tax=Sandaracinobacteroides hominis TaxID=2780086 RepID=UPI0018F39082|nr:hypothetical protein [Sandaracinobacteroides hominis]
MGTGASATQRIMASIEPVRQWMDGPSGKRAQRFFSGSLSILILWLLASSIAEIGWRQVLAALPANPLFWLCFAGAYFILPLTDWFIYRRWWKLGWRDIGVFLKMRVMNEALVSYSGHTYLLIWAAERMGIAFDPKAPPPRILGRGDGQGVDPATSPFAAVKDMAITSGLAGNLGTLIMLLLALGLGGNAVVGEAFDRRTLDILIWSFGAMILLNIGIVAFRGRVMSLPVKENMFAFRWHLFRLLLGHALLVLSWVVALPMIPFGSWFQLGALRQVVARMPLPNKELLFAAIAVSIAGEASVEVAALMAAQGALHLVFHGISWAMALAIEKRPVS